MCRNKYFSLLLFASAMLFSSCSNTRLTDTYLNNAYPKPLQSVLVVCISEQETTRHLFERRFANEFELRGCKAVESNSLMLPMMKPPLEVLQEAAAKRQLQAILITHLVATGEREVYHAPKPYMEKFYRGGEYYSHWRYRRSIIYAPGYYTRQQFEKLETRIHETATNRLIWSAVSESRDPESSQEIIEELAVLVIRELEKNGLLSEP
ncbi:MAG: hypothetical protein JXA52_09080 [Planctomycetes bacterium]|nr:hypothetical protein [Planctomycetota bacterium]